MSQRRLNEHTSELSASLNRLGSGLRVNRAGDDAAGLAIASSLKVDSRVFQQGIRNINDGISLSNIAEGGLDSLSTITIRLKELTFQSANGTLSMTQRRSLDAEADALVEEYNRLVATTSFNGSALLDGEFGVLAIQAGYGDSGSIRVGLGDKLARTVGNGTFYAPVTYTTSPGTGTNSGTVLADVNHDGVIDLLATSDAASFGLRVLLGNEDGSFNAGTLYSATVGIRFPAAADVNHDGNLDLVATSSGGGLIAFYLGNSNGSFKAAQNFTAETNAWDAQFADMNGDGDLDIVSGNFGQNVTVRFGNGDGTFLARRASALTDPTAIAIADYNGDGVEDIFVGERSIGVVRLLAGNGDGTFRIGISIAVGANPRSIVTTDLNNDGFDDLAVHVDGAIRTYYGNGNGTFRIGLSQVLNGTTNWQSVQAGDLNGDGWTDLTVGALTTDRVFTLLSNGDQTFRVSAALETGHSNDLADINRDGVLDIVVGASGAPGTTAIFLGNSVLDSRLPVLNIRTQEQAWDTMELLDATLLRVNAERGSLGALQSRLATAASNLAVARENGDAAASRILDVDVATESSELAKRSILQQATQAVLVQANQQPGLALQLLRF